MTPEEFIEAHRTQTPLAFAATVSQLSEPQRKTLSKAAQQLLKEARESERELRRPEVLMRLMANRAANMNVFSDRQLQVARAALAVLAVCPRSAAAKPVNWTDETSRAAVRILLDRRPDWADAWLEAQFQMRWGLFRFEEAIQLIRAGVCKRPTSAGYARLYAAAAVTLDHETQPDLLEDLWLLFQHDVSTWAYAPKPKEINLDQWKANARHQPGESYQGAYFRLVYHLLHQGHIDRQRLLDEILAALWRDFNSSARAGLVKLHDLIEPTASERQERQPTYRELLRHDAPAVVGFGLQMLKLIQKDGQLDAPLFMEAIPRVMLQKSRSQPAVALSLLKTVVKGQVDLLPAAIDVAASAIRHETADIQEEALGLLESWVPHVGHEFQQNLTDCSATISPKLRARFEALLRPAESIATGSQPQTDAVPTGHINEVHEISLRDRLAAIPSKLQEEYELPLALAAIERSEIPPPLDLDRLSCVLCDLRPVVPIRDLDELIDAVSRAVEMIDTPLDIERILDAIGRFSTSSMPNFRQRTEPLANRYTILGSTFSMQPNLNWLSNELPSLRGLIQDWLYQQSYVEVKNSLSSLFSGSWLTARREGPACRAVEHRIIELRKRFSQKSPGSLLSLATHEHGWVDARVFVRRVQKLLQSGHTVGRCDLAWGLLRLAPDGREEAIAASRCARVPALYDLDGDREQCDDRS